MNGYVDDDDEGDTGIYINAERWSMNIQPDLSKSNVKSNE